VAVTAILLGLSQGILSDQTTFNRLSESKQAYMAVEALTEDVLYRQVYGTFNWDNTESLTFAGATVFATTTYDMPSDIYTIRGMSFLQRAIRKTELELSITAGTNLAYGLLSGVGGISLANSARVIGDTYANGPIIGPGGANKAEVIGDIVSAGPSGLVADVEVTGSVFADTIEDVIVSGDAYFNNELGTNSIAGASTTPVVNQATSSFPLSTTTIQEWKDAINNYGTVITASDTRCDPGVTDTYTIDASVSLDPYLRIECNVDIKKTGASTIVTLEGPIWIEGNLSFTQGPTLRVDPALGRRSVQILVDNPNNSTSSSQIEVRNATDFLGSGDSRSYILLWSANESSALGESETAISISQSANGQVIMYAADGLVDISNGIELRAVTGHQIDVAQNSDIIYEAGLSSLLFPAGPGSGYVLTDWQQAE